MPAPPFAGTAPRLSLKPTSPRWVSAPQASGSETIAAPSAQIYLWGSPGATVSSVALPAIAPIRRQLNPNPRYPFWAGQAIPRANPPAGASVNLPLNAPSGQLLIQGVPGAVAGVGVSPQSGQIRAQAAVPAIVGTASESAVSAQLRLWPLAAPAVQPVSSSPLRKRLNPNPQFPFWPGAPRAITGLPPANASLNAPSAQISLRAQTSAVLTTQSAITPSSSQVRFWSQINASTQLASPSAQLRVRSRVTSVSAGATVNSAAGQVRVRGTTATVSGSASVSGRAAQLRVQATSASVSSGIVANTSGQIRAWTTGGTVVGGLTIVNASTAQVRVNATIPTVLTGTVIFGASGQMFVRATKAAITGTATATVRTAQVRFWSAAAPRLTLGTSILVNAPTSQFRLYAGVPTVAASTTIPGVSAQLRVRSRGASVSVDSSSASITAPAAQVRLVGGGPVRLIRGRAYVSLADARTTAVLLTDAI